MRRGAFSCPGEAQSFTGRRLDGDLVRRSAQGGGDVAAHLVHVRSDLRRLQDHRRVHIEQGEPVLDKKITDVSQQEEARDSLETGVGIGEMFADVAQGGGPQQRVGDGMHQDVRIRMPVQPLRMGDINATQDQFPSFPEPMDVVPEADARRFCDAVT